ncbi:MAG: nicotinate-nucleotide adenylyltransferase [Ureaplasma sp.]|nr:nicotinate-nucleotide adenylyltransferase [Ureaplasma sp.]MDE7221751.1 nicotinate-nucleotide adenylyltransferase [Ureaplasma sp.]
MNLQSFKILIFGGTFNPIHYGHMNILNCAREKINPDLTILIPTANSIHKDKYPIDPLDRMNMLRIAFKDYKNLLISDLEINKNSNSYTYNTIIELKKQYQNAEFYLLIGSDQWNNLSSWYNYVELAKEVKFVIAKRDNLELKKYSNFNSIVLENSILDINSTRLRSFVKKYEIPYNVLEYINNNGLYAIQRIESLMSNHRFSHSLRVAQYAQKLMLIHDRNKANIAFSAGIYHDIAKEMPLSEQEILAKNILGIYDYNHPKLLHGYIGAYLLQNNFCFSNNEILNAIARHTKPFDYFLEEPDLLTKVVYLADKLEPNRTNEDVFGSDINYFRKLAETNIDKCFLELYNLLQTNLSKK